MDYSAYIASAAWRLLRAEAIARDGGRCRLCDAGGDLEVHHRRYPVGGRWDLDCLEALTTVCTDCHDRVTSDLRGRRYGLRRRLPVADVVRLTPGRLEGGAVERLPVPAVQDRIRVTPAHAQWELGRPVERAREADRPGGRQAAQD